MAYCSKCGKPVNEDAYYCTNCGSMISRSAPGAQDYQSGGSQITPPPPPSSGIDAVINSQKAQDYWLRRVIAYVIDSVIVSIIVGFFAAVLFIPTLITQIVNGGINVFSWVNFGTFPLFVGLLMLLYFPFSETIYGSTFGKSLMHLKVTTLNGGKPDIGQAFVRNISKIYWILLLLDIVFGLATQADYKQKFSDKYVNTVVVEK